MSEEFTEEGLKALLSQEITSAITFENTERSAKTSKALEYFRGEMTDTPAMSGRSSVVSKDVADTIGWMLPGIIRVFTASDQMVSYEPQKQGDEALSKQASEYVNYVFMRDNPGYRNLWDSTHDSLLLGNGIIKHWWDDKEECEYSEHSGLTEDQIAVILSENDNVPPPIPGKPVKQHKPTVEIVAHKEGEPQIIQVPGPDGQPVEVPIRTHDIKVKRVTSFGRLKIKCIEPEDFLINREATCIEDARFCSHREHISRSDLVEMGFDKELIENLPTDRFSSMQQERISRDETSMSINMVGDGSMMLIELHECYIKADVDGDGVAETVRAFYAGGNGTGELLDWEVWDDDVPFSDIPCEPVPHRWEARSVFDDVGDIQRVKTVLTRQMLDNLYWVNNPMNYAEEGTVANPEMLRSPRFGGTVWLKKGATQPPTPLPVPFIGDKALLGLQHFDNVREMRTGVSRSTMALDPEALQNQTATANQNQKDSAYSQIELIARNQAELGWRRVFRQILKLVVKHQDRPRTIRLRDTWVEMDPRSWNANMDVTVNIGLGTGSRDRDMAMLNQILNVQMAMTDRLAQGGFSKQALEMVPKINMTATKLAESAGIKNPDQFYLDLKPDEIEEMKQQAANPPKSPEVMKIEADAQGQQNELQQRDKELMVNAQIGQQADERKAQIESVQMQADIEAQDRKTQAEMVKDEREYQLKERLALLEFGLERELKMAENARKDREHQQKMEAGFFKAAQGQQAHEQKLEQAKAKPTGEA